METLPWFHNFSQRASRKNPLLIKTTMSDRYVNLYSFFFLLFCAKYVYVSFELHLVILDGAAVALFRILLLYIQKLLLV